MDQNESNIIKLDFWWNNRWNIPSDFQLCLFFDQIESDLSNMNQTWSNWISDEIIIEIYNPIFHFIYLLIGLNQIRPKWIKMDQSWSNWISDEIIIEIYHQICPKWIKMDQTWSNWISDWNLSSNFQLYLFFDQIESDPSKLDQNGSNLIKLDFWWNNQNFSLSWYFDHSLNVDITSCHIYHENKKGHIIFDQIGSALSKIDQTWFT